MSLPNPNNVVTESRLKEFYNGILPYLGGSAEAGFTPIGTIISVMGVTAPANYLACDGTVYNIADYPELANYFYQQFGSKNKFGGNGTTTFAVPDLRGEFLRGTGTNSHTDIQGSCNGADVGVHQNATGLLIYNFDDRYDDHKIDVLRVQKGGNSTIVDSDGYVGTTTVKDNIYRAQISVSSYTQMTFGTAVPTKIATRPTNTSVLYCIATKNIYLNPSLDYSTDEKVVGQWIDGKTRYQRTFYGTTPSAINTGEDFGNHDLEPLSIDYIVSYKGVIVKHENATTNSYFNENSNGWLVWVNNRRIRNKVTAENVASINGYITIQYTKTT